MRNPLDHVAFITEDTGKTHDFYVHVMGWPLVVAWGDEHRETPFFITGYDAGGWTIEFEEQVGVPLPPPSPAPFFPHFGLVASGDDELAAWKRRLDEHGVSYVEAGTDLFFSDPNNVTFQIHRKGWHGFPEELDGRLAENLRRWQAFRSA